MTELVQVSEKLLKTAGRGEERGRMPGLEIYHLGGGSLPVIVRPGASPAMPSAA